MDSLFAYYHISYTPVVVVAVGNMLDRNCNTFLLYDLMLIKNKKNYYFIDFLFVKKDFFINEDSQSGTFS
jgi:hypothetical protein